MTIQSYSETDNIDDDPISKSGCILLHRGFLDLNAEDAAKHIVELLATFDPGEEAFLRLQDSACHLPCLYPFDLRSHEPILSGLNPCPNDHHDEHPNR